MVSSLWKGIQRLPVNKYIIVHRWRILELSLKIVWDSYYIPWGKEYRRDDKQPVPSHTPHQCSKLERTLRPHIQSQKSQGLGIQETACLSGPHSRGKTKWSVQTSCEFGCRRLSGSVTPVLRTHHSLRTLEVSVWLACIFSVSPTLA